MSEKQKDNFMLAVVQLVIDGYSIQQVIKILSGSAGSGAAQEKILEKNPVSSRLS